MSYASQSGRARTSTTSPEAHAICDKCGFRFNHNDLQWQKDWRGSSIKNLNILCCSRCLDKPQEQLRAIAIPADPVPIKNSRTQDFDEAEGDFRVTSPQIAVDFWTSIRGPGGAPQRATQTGSTRVSQTIGKTGGKEVPPGFDIGASMSYFNGKKYNVVIPVSTIVADGSSVLVVTCPSLHGLSTNDQIIISSSAINIVDGFYSIVFIDTLRFSFSVNLNVTIGTAILRPSTIIKTTLVGLPRGNVTIPQVGS